MNIIDRARFLMFGDLPLRKARATATADPLVRAILTGLGKQAVWSSQDFTTLSKEGYEKCMAVYACVTKIAAAAAGIQFRLTDGTDKAVDDHPLLDLLWRPNEYEGQRAWMRRRFSQLLLHGNSYVQAVRPMSSMPPVALFLPMPQRMRVVPGSGGVLVGGYEYEVRGQKTPLDPRLVLHSKLFHPTDDWYGLSPLTVASRGVDVSNMAAEWNMRLLQNDMRPPGVLATELQLGDAQYQRLRASVKEQYQGYENAGEPLLLEGGLSWQQMSISPKELDWIQGIVHNKREIAAVFNIAPELIGDSANKTYSNFQEARRSLYTETVLPLMDEFVDDLNTWLCPMFGDNLWLSVDRNQIEALQEDREKKFAYINAAEFMKLDEKRMGVGLDPVGKAAGGEAILVSAGKVPLEFVAIEPGPPAEEATEEKPAVGDNEDDNEKDKGGKKTRRLSNKSWAPADRKEALWHNFVRRVETKERSLVAIAYMFLKDQADRVSKTRSVDVEAEAREYFKRARPWAYQAARRAIAAGVRASKGELPELEEKVDLYDLSPEALEYLDQIILESGTKIAKTTMALVRDQLRIAEAEDWTTEELTQRLIDKLKSFAHWRCRTIARTESAKVENWGQVEGYKDTEFVTRKGWMCSFVPDSRDAHISADGQEVGVTEDFHVDGQAMAYPGDPRGDAGNVVNCLCTTYPIVD